MNIDLNGNISDWENDPVYNSIIELMNWGQGCANVNACNYDQISNYDNEACWFKNDGCQCSDGENAVLNNDGACDDDDLDMGENLSILPVYYYLEKPSQTHSTL